LFVYVALQARRVRYKLSKTGEKYRGEKTFDEGGTSGVKTSRGECPFPIIANANPNLNQAARSYDHTNPLIAQHELYLPPDV